MNYTRQMIEYGKEKGECPYYGEHETGLQDFFKADYVEYVEVKADKLDIVMEKLKHSRGLFKMLIPGVQNLEPEVSAKAQVIDDFIIALLDGITDEEWASEKL